MTTPNSKAHEIYPEAHAGLKQMAEMITKQSTTQAEAYSVLLAVQEVAYRAAREQIITSALRTGDEQEADRVIRRLSDLLTRTANTLKGQPLPLHLHSWHDLPELAELLIDKIAVQERDMRQLAERIDALVHDRVASIEQFYQRVNERAEAEMLAGAPIEGAHHRALEVEMAARRRT